MDRSNDLVRKSQSILSYINSQAVNQDCTTPKDLLPVIYGLQTVFPQWVSMICPTHHPQWFYVSENCKNVFGFTAGYIEKYLQPLQYFQQVHEADVEDLYQCFAFIETFFREAAEDSHTFRLVFNYRFRHSDGHCILLHDEKAIYQTSDGHNLYYSLFRDITEHTAFTGVKVEIFKNDDRIRKVTEFKPSQAKKLSARESQLIGLIKKGLTTKEIAHHLSISHNTVRNIRSRMFEKYSVSNVIELLNMAG
jgi:DNA-binding CsgD family transcriptional regulator